MKNKIDLNANIGKTYTRIDFTIGTSPAVECISDKPLPANLAAQLLKRLNALMQETLGDNWCWTLSGPEIEIQHSETIDPPDVRSRKFSEMFRRTPEQKATDEQHQRERLHSLETHEHNSTLGWWRVEGIRHGALVRADSALKAIQKSEIDGWESPSVAWIGVELPDVIEA